MWDLGGDEFGSFEDVGILEVDNLSLDEPEMEAMLFTDDMDGDKEAEDELQVIGSNQLVAEFVFCNLQLYVLGYVCGKNLNMMSNVIAIWC